MKVINLLNQVKVFLGLMILILILVNCEKQNEEFTDTPPPPKPYSIEIVSGNGQYVKKGGDMDSIVIAVNDQYGDGFGGANINITTEYGQLLQQDFTTNKNGELLIKWQQENKDGRQVLHVNAYKEDDSTHLQGSPMIIYILGYTDTIRDIDNNLYHTITIGNQEWLMENLAVTRYNDGDSIIESSRYEDITSFSKAVFCWYNDNESFAKNNKLGALYNWNVVRTGKLCPVGWHVPSVEEWDELLSYVSQNGFEDEVPHALKAANGWSECEGVNYFGFTAIPSGMRGWGNFRELDYSCSWWTSTNYDCGFECAEMKKFSSCSNEILTGTQIYFGRSIRCVKD